MTAPWFFIEDLPVAGGAVHIPRDEARHALGSKRLGPGDELTLFDGRGGVSTGRIGADRTTDGSVSVAVDPRRESPPQKPRIHLGTAIPKGDRFGTLIEVVASMGVAEFTALDCERSVVSLSDALRARAERLSIEACKQSRNAWLPAISGPTPLAQWAQQQRQRGLEVIAADPSGAAIGAVTADCALAIGPEGGFSPAELMAMRTAGVRMASLGSNILRIELAACALLAAARMPR